MMATLTHPPATKYIISCRMLVLVHEEADDEADTKVTVDRVSEVWIEMPPVVVLPLQTRRELVFCCRQTIQPDIGGVWQPSVQQSRVTGSIISSSNVRRNWITKNRYQQAVSGSTGTLTLPRAFDLPNGWQKRSSMEWRLHIKSMQTCGNWSCDIESQYTCYTESNLVQPTQSMLCYCCILQFHPCHQCIVVSFPESA